MKDYHQSLVIATDDRQKEENSLYSTSSSTSFSSSFDRSKSLLNQEQIQRLLDVIDDEFEVHGRGNFPTLKVRLSRFIRTLDQRVQAKNLFVKRAKMNGGAASYVLLAGGGRSCPSTLSGQSVSMENGDRGDPENGNFSPPLENLYKNESAQTDFFSSSLSNDVETIHDQSFGDIDLIFDVDLTQSTNFDLFKQCALETLIEFLPEDANRSKITDAVMQDAYVKKMVKIGGYYNSSGSSQSGKKDVNSYRCKQQQQIAQQQGDLWSLITLNNDQGRCIELKFVDRIKRQFEFSVDSFQIHLDWLLYLEDDFDDCKANVKRFLEQNGRLKTMKIVAESVYGDFQLALKHLNEKLIDTVEPELIRGGGLLKYVHLLIKGYRPAVEGDREKVSKMERYMCSRFFIDFGRLDQQERKLRAYLDDHLISYPVVAKMDFLRLLYDVVDSGTVCLMNHERRASLQMISRLCSEMQNALSATVTPPPSTTAPAPPQQAASANQNFYFIPGHQTPPILQAPPILLEDNHGNYLLDDPATKLSGRAAPNFLSRPPPSSTAFYFMPQQNATFFVPVV